MFLGIFSQNQRRTRRAAVTVAAMTANSLSIPAALPIDWPSELLRHGRWLRGVLLARSRDWHAIDELLQAVSIAVLQAPALRDPSRVAPWLYRVAVRIALLHRRRLGRERRLQSALAQHEQSVARTAQSPLDWLVAVERNQLIRQALGCLPSKEAELLLLKYIEDWSYCDIAEHLGITESAVESRLTRARSKLRAQLLRGSRNDPSSWFAP